MINAIQANDIKSTYGGVDILVNNAGIVQGYSVINSHAEDVEKTIEVNLLAQFWVNIYCWLQLE